MKLWYASDVDFTGLTISVPQGDPYANASPLNGAYLYAVTVPEPAGIALCLPAFLLLLRRPHRSRDWAS